MAFEPGARIRGCVAAGITAMALLVGCRSGESPAPVAPGVGDGANLRLEQVVFTQVVQNDAYSIPLVAGAPAVAKVLVSRSRESIVEVPVVLRLFRAGTLVHTDTTRTGGVLGRGYSFAASSAEFLLPARWVGPDITWQVELDPRRVVPDSVRTDNRLPAVGTNALQTVAVRPFRVRLIPVVLARHANITGDVTLANADIYLRVTRQLFPLGDVHVSIGAPLTTLADFGVKPDGGGTMAFWEQVLGAIEQERVASGAVDEHWYGVVPVPPGYGSISFGGLAYVGFSAGGSLFPSYAAAGVDARGSTPGYASLTLAHELGHNLGRTHAPGCSPTPPVDAAYPNGNGAITAVGHDVWSWLSGASFGAPTVGAETADLMSYCAPPKWISAHNYSAILHWRMAGEVAAASVRAVPRAVMP